MLQHEKGLFTFRLFGPCWLDSLAWLWLWHINFGYKNLGWYLPKSGQFQRKFFEMEKYRDKKNGSIRILKIIRLCQYLSSFFWNLFSFKNIGTGKQILASTFFHNFNFWTTLFCKNGPNFLHFKISFKPGYF